MALQSKIRMATKNERVVLVDHPEIKMATKKLESVGGGARERLNYRLYIQKHIFLKTVATGICLGRIEKSSFFDPEFFSFFQQCIFVFWKYH